MCKICPKCGGIAEYNAYYGRITCTRCPWESEKIRVMGDTFAKAKVVARAKKQGGSIQTT